METTNENAERLTAACALSAVGGFLDVYTYLCRGGVFANAVTGNMVLLGFNLAGADWGRSLRFVLPILFYSLGVFTADTVHDRLPDSRRVTWHQSVVLLELACLVGVCFIPQGRLDFAVNALVSFVCAMQVQAFRRVRGLPFASTMCTGNLRSGTDALFAFIHTRDRGELYKALHYYGVIACFILGATAGAFLIKRFGPAVFPLAPLGLAAVFFLISSEREK